MELSSSNIKKFLKNFLKRKLFLYFGKRTPSPPSKKKNPYISENENPKKLFIFLEVTFRAQKLKKIPTLKLFLIFREMKLSSPQM